MLGTLLGRGDAAYLARFLENNLLDMKAYEYWDEPKVLAEADRYPALYCAYIHPQKDNDEQLWFIMSMWGPYNAFLMCADMKPESPDHKQGFYIIIN
ncbi:DUF4185 domain-containing protein [Bacteroides muris (ex Fokt et al. 2023)]|uniref:DUF4185 domain-containing protein n=3 Tax=Bacteroides TaxID=816 RepID=A0A9X2NQ85_9BACE|nr:DUF4185 domain-containing protein [Bacteroides muris (ex Fokt et al. 2023)]MCR6503306.1 DUF4185 domain-containing protein [Bacteroides muris (ex Fokt et al. 2023)]